MADLNVRILGLTLKNPVMPGAGPQVDSGREIAAAAAGGAGALVGRTVTVAPVPPAEPGTAAIARDSLIHCQSGSVRPFSDWVAQEYPQALAAARACGVPLIASVGFTAEAVRELGPPLEALGVDAIELALHGAGRHEAVPAARALREAVRVPVIAKLSPHHGDDLADLAVELAPHVDAFTCIGSFGPVLALDVEQGAAALGGPFGIGFQSGVSIRPIAQRFVFEVARRVGKPVIACGGVASGQDAIAMLMAGASAVQVCTHAILRGPSVYGRIAREMAAWLDAHGYGSVAEVSGLYLHRYGHGQRVVVEKEECPQLDPGKCITCSICEQVCFYDAIQAPPRVLPEIRFDPCFECGLCVSACPTGALAFRPRAAVTRLAGEGE